MDNIYADTPATIEGLSIQTNGIRLEIRIDWSNDRHQAVEVFGTDADAVKQALLRAVTALGQEQIAGKI